jgi:hypothetical protein
MRVRFVIALIVAFVAGLVVGIASFRGPRSTISGRGVSAPRAVQSAAESVVMEPARETSTAKGERLIATALRKGRHHERQNDLFLALGSFDAKDFQQLIADGAFGKTLAQTLRDLDWQTRTDLVSGIVSRWVTLDPNATRAWAERLLELIPASHEARNPILDALALKAPEELLALVSSRKDGSERREIIARALRQLAARDLPKAQSWLNACTDPADRRAAERAISIGIAQADPLRAVELAGSVENRQIAYDILQTATASAAKTGSGKLRQLAMMPMKSWMLSTVLQEFAERDPEQAAEMAIKSVADGGDASFGIQAAFSALARTDLDRAIAKLEGLEGANRAMAVSALGAAWAAREPAKALDWLMERPASERVDSHRGANGSNDALIIAFVGWAGDDPTAARTWANALPPGTMKNAVQSQLARTLAANGDPAQAIEVLAQLGTAADPTAVTNIASNWARRDPEAAANWALTEPGSVQSRALAGIVGTWGNDDPEGVAKWLAQFPPGEARDRSVAAFLWRGSAWSASREDRLAEFETWFDGMQDPWLRAKVARSSYWQRKESDPVGARQWLASLPNVDPEVIRVTLRDSDD